MRFIFLYNIVQPSFIKVQVKHFFYFTSMNHIHDLIHSEFYLNTYVGTQGLLMGSLLGVLKGPSVMLVVWIQVGLMHYNFSIMSLAYKGLSVFPKKDILGLYNICITRSRGVTMSSFLKLNMEESWKFLRLFWSR